MVLTARIIHHEEPDPHMHSMRNLQVMYVASNPEGRISECTDIPTHTCIAGDGGKNKMYL